ncbi:MAG: gas vesicle protein GvpD P-loop domain-containing protein [Candidatus Freyarchaeota archaeon]
MTGEVSVLRIDWIPKEVVEAFNRLKGYKLLVKGAPGTGKTLFALSICEFLNSKGPALYLSTRVTPEELYSTYPWVRDLIPSRNILDATDSRYQPPEDLATAFRYVEKPAFLQAMYEICTRSPKPTAIIVDSIEALRENLHISEEDLSLENSLIDLSRMTKTNLIIVSETERPKPIDHLVDGIVRQIEKKESLFIRLTEIQKLRGINVRNPLYLFTLQGGRYQVLPPQWFSLDNLVQMEKEPKKFEHIRNPKGMVSTGIRYLDTVTGGGYFHGSANLIEIQRDTGESYDYFYLPTIYNQILNGGNVFIIPPSGMTAQAVKRMITPITGEREFIRHVKVADFRTPPAARVEEGERGEAWMVTLEGSDLRKDYQKMYNEAAAMRRGQETVLVVIACDTLELVYGWRSEGDVDIAALISRGIIDTKQAGNTSLCLAKYGQERLADYVNHISDNHFRVSNVEGTVVLKGVFPNFPAMYPMIEKSEKGFRVELTPIT